MSGVPQHLDRVSEIGTWRVLVTPPGRSATDVTTVRGVPTQLGTLSFNDPFGPGQGSLTFPGLTMLDRRGEFDLSWFVPDSNVDIFLDGPVPPNYPWPRLHWAGFLTGAEFSDVLGVSVPLVGAMMQSDHDLAKPYYPANPLAYEQAIASAFRGKPWLRLGQLQVQWPSWWDTFYSDDPNQPSYLKPLGIEPGAPWSGLVTRSTGSWNPMLSSYVNSMLTAMYTGRGRFTLDLFERTPVLLHRDIKHVPDEMTVVIDLAAQGVKASLNEDWTQSGNVFYGQTTSLQGVGYSGLQVGPDGAVIGYRPLAARNQVWPVPADGVDNGWFDPDVMRREVNLQLPPGLDTVAARRVGKFHLDHFREPGVTGTVTLRTDPMLASGQRISRFYVRAGMSLLLSGYNGHRDGLLVHVVSSTMDLRGSRSVTLTVDSLYRDQLTVAEVRARGRDALSVTRMLVAGSYQPVIPDQLYPWNYAEGSGFIPGGPQYSAVGLFTGMDENMPFPWLDMTRARAPWHPSWQDCYIPLGPVDTANATNNWAVVPNGTGVGCGFPIRMAQSGTIMLIELAAYHADGSLFDIPFHVSFYYSNSVNPSDMPMIHAGDVIPSGYSYAPGQYYPYTAAGWEQYNSDGTLVNPQLALTTSQSSGLIRAYGTLQVPAGYFPGSPGSPGAVPTGMLRDETQMPFDVTTFSAQQFNPYSVSDNLTNPLLGYCYAMIYCDAQGDEPVYFLGRMFRLPPGSSAGG